MLKALADSVIGLFAGRKCQDVELPLDGTLRTRLVSMRLRRERALRPARSQRKNFLTMLHSVGSPLPGIRKNASRLKKHWTFGDDNYIQEALLKPAIANHLAFLMVGGETGSMIDEVLDKRVM